jgi:hypothetical protein
MNRLTITSALFLSACAPAVEVAPVVIPAPLLQPVKVECRRGETSQALGECAIALRSGLDTANGKIEAIGELWSTNTSR